MGRLLSTRPAATPRGGRPVPRVRRLWRRWLARRARRGIRLVAFVCLVGGVGAAPPAGAVAPPEPDILAVRAAARLRQQRRAAPFERAVRNLQWSAALPSRVAVHVARYDELDLTGTEYEDGLRRRLSAEDRLTWWVDVQWDLRRLAWHPDQLAVHRARDRLRQRADDAVELAVRLYYERQALRAHLAADLAAGLGVDPKMPARVDELTHRLDVLTDGLFCGQGRDPPGVSTPRLFVDGSGGP